MSAGRNTKTLFCEYNGGGAQFNRMREIVEFTTDSARRKALIDIEFDGSYQGEASISLWDGDRWNRVYTLLSPRGTYGYCRSSPEVFAIDRATLINVLTSIS